MHSAKEEKRQDHKGYQSMSGLRHDDSANQNGCASIGSGERAGQNSPKGRDFCPGLETRAPQR
jgi:hypothetical protein